MMKSSSKHEKRSQTRSAGLRYSQLEKPESLLDSDVLSMDSTESALTGQRLTDVSWSAGYIDGEGCFRMSTTPIISIDSTCRTTIENVYRILGGNCYALKRKTAVGRPVFRWKVFGDAALECCEILVPFLKDKKEQAFLLSTIYKYPPNSAMRGSIKRRLKNLKGVSL